MSRNTKHRKGSLVFGLGVGVLVAWGSYQWITSPEQLAERQRQEAIVLYVREALAEKLALQDLQVVDPLAPNRSVGKVYVFPQDEGWQVSGYYRRNDADRWHSYLVILNADETPRLIRVEDDERSLVDRAADDASLEVLP